MHEEALGKIVTELADIANCASGDFHALHLNIRGTEFDSLHRKVFKKYYEEASDDFDEFAEKALMFVPSFPSPNKSAERIGYRSFEDGCIEKGLAVERAKEVMELIQENYMLAFQALNVMTGCPRCLGIANFLQTRLEYWSKECYYFNSRRSC